MESVTFTILFGSMLKSLAVVVVVLQYDSTPMFFALNKAKYLRLYVSIYYLHMPSVLKNFTNLIN